MSRFLKSISRLISSVRAKPVGHDLQGNKYFEIPSPNGGRTKRTVDYKIKQDLSEYANGDKLPVQWVSWLSHTRSLPPSIQELETDLQRRYILQQRVALIDARDAEESSRRLLGQKDGSLLPIEGGSRGAVEEVVKLENEEERLEENLEKLSSGSFPPSSSSLSTKPSTSKHEPTPSSPPNITHSSLPNPSTSTSPTLRELSQLTLQKQRKELEQKGVDLELEAERAGYKSASGSGSKVEEVKGPNLTARRRGGAIASQSSSSQTPGGVVTPTTKPRTRTTTTTTTTTTPESLRSIGKAQSEFERASKEMNKPVLDGIGPLFDAKDVLKGNKNVGGKVRTEEGGAEGTKSDTWAAARDRRDKGE